MDIAMPDIVRFDMDKDTEREVDKDAEIDELEDGTFESDHEDDNAFKIRDPLLPPSAMTFTTEELHGLIHDGQIDLNPPYQRDVVWPASKQVGLIDSIFRNFYIPPIVFAIRREDGEEVRVCVDGKQRLTSIQKFFDGQIPHRDFETKKTYWYTRSEAHKNSRLDIPRPAKKAFAEKVITCVEYRDLQPGAEREIFQRVQMGMTLTMAEKLQAIPGPWAEWTSDLESKHVTCDGGLGQILDWDTKRGRNFQCIVHLLYCCEGYPDEHLLPTAAKMEKWLTREDIPPHGFKGVIDSVLTTFYFLASTREYNKGFREIEKRLAPVEFVFIGVLLYALRKRTYVEQANAIFDMRKYIRSQFQDIRANTNVGKALWEFITNVVAHPESSHLMAGLSSPAETRKGKRKRASGRDDDDDDEYRPQPVRGLGAALKTRSKR